MGELSAKLLGTQRLNKLFSITVQHAQITQMEELTCPRHPKTSELGDAIAALEGPLVSFSVQSQAWREHPQWTCTLQVFFLAWDVIATKVTLHQDRFFSESFVLVSFIFISFWPIQFHMPSGGVYAYVTNHFHCVRKRRIRLNGKLCWNRCSIAYSVPSKASCLKNVSKSVMFFCILCQILAIKSIIKQLLSLPKDILNWSLENGAYNWITTDQLSQQPPPPPNTNERKEIRWHDSNFYSDDIPLLCPSTEPSRTEEKSSSSLRFPKAY